MTKQNKKWLTIAVIALVAGILAFIIWKNFLGKDELEGLISANGRIEAVEIDIATKTPGRVMEILVREGEFVTAGTILAMMDTEILEAQQRQVKAELEQAKIGIETARSRLKQRESERAAAMAVVRQREAELGIAKKHANRSSTLASKGAASQQKADDDKARVQGAIATVCAAQARVASSEAAISTARSEIAQAQSAVEAVGAAVERITADIKDCALKSPRDGRIQYLIAQPGEVIGAGGRVVNLVDLSDVYMTFFLPTAMAGRIALGTEVRLVLDAAPQYVVPAKISFVADVAQFTPKTVETSRERAKLMFRVRAQIPKELLQKYILHVKTGLPGMAYIRLDPTKDWPDHLKVKGSY
ncbi:MAG: HlyD family efflux transporter periplasmic adaptor subunit [Desulforegulaceae bacterium]|nr:HlyD family efflux transporter periplasmic adaptor subunit [Desulforegulaceae bacterium]